MPGWDGFDIPAFMRRYVDAPVLVDNDVNLMALGEFDEGWREVRHLLFVKIATGIGAGIVADGRLNRGAQGSAGDLGHVRSPGEHARPNAPAATSAAWRRSPPARPSPPGCGPAGSTSIPPPGVVELVRVGQCRCTAGGAAGRPGDRRACWRPA